MDRAAFLEAAKAAAPKLRRVDLPCFPEPVYLRRMSVAEIRHLAAEAKAEKEGADTVNQDALAVAVLVRDETGELLFDRNDSALMAELQAALAGTDFAVLQTLLQASNTLDDPEPDEADAEGN